MTDTGGGFYNEGEIHTSGGDVVGRDQYNIDARGGTVILGGQPAAPAKLPPMPERGILPPPGNLPPGSRLPHLRNAVFTGRETDLLILTDHLFHKAARPAAVVVSGPGGFGKSQLAVELCYRYGPYLAGVHWISTASPDAIPSEIAACGARLRLPTWPKKTAEQVEITLRAWHSDPRRLIVLDNLEDEEALRGWLPALAGMPIFVTTRRAAWPPDLDLRLHRLKVLPRPHSLALLRRLAPRLVQTSETDLADLAGRLGDLPLALDLAGRYLEECASLAVSDYLASLTDEGTLLHDSLVNWTRATPTAHATSLATTFELSYQQLNEQVESDRLARRIFWLAGYCAPNQPIPPDLLRSAALEENDRTVAFDRGLRRVVELGLLSPGEAGPAIHPLLAEFARLVEEGNPFTHLVDALIAESRTAYQSGQPTRFRPLRPHLEAAAAWTQAHPAPQASTLLSHLAVHLRTAAEFAQARDLFAQVLGLDEQIYGPNHPEVATDANNLGQVLQDLGDYARARIYIERALRIDEQASGPESEKVAMRANNLGLALKNVGDLAGARTQYERALQIAEKIHQPDHPEIARAAGNLGRLLHEIGDLDGAKVHIEQALRIAEQNHGPEHPTVAIFANNLGAVLHDLGNLAEAKVFIEWALRINEQVYGSNNPNVANLHNNLGLTLKALGDLEGAQEHIARSLVIFEQFLPPDHPNVRTVRENLAAVRRQSA